MVTAPERLRDVNPIPHPNNRAGLRHARARGVGHRGFVNRGRKKRNNTAVRHEVKLIRGSFHSCTVTFVRRLTAPWPLCLGEVGLEVGGEAGRENLSNSQTWDRLQGRKAFIKK